MGAEREDTDPNPQKGGTEPGLGPPSKQAANGGAAPEPPPPVDFDALHAALGAVEEPAAKRRSVPDVEPVATPPPLPGAGRVGESQGRSSAQYASARPHTIPPTRAPDEPPDIPAVIVATDDTVPTAPPAMTTPLGAPPPPPPVPAPASGPHPAHAPASGPHAVAGSGPHAAAQPSYPFTPQPFAVQRLPPQPTMRMADRPRRPKSPTIVVRKRGPSAVQKLAAFMAMLLLVTAVGIAVIIWRRPSWLGIDAFPIIGGTPSAAPAASSATVAPSASPTSSATPSPPATTTAASSAAPTASVRVLKPVVPKPVHSGLVH